MSATRLAADMIERSARDLPVLAELFRNQWSSPLFRRVEGFLRSRMDRRELRQVDDVKVAARFVIETITWFARHRFHDLDGYRLDETRTEATVVELIVSAFSLQWTEKRRRVTLMTDDLGQIDWSELAYRLGNRLLRCGKRLFGPVSPMPRAPSVRMPWPVCATHSASKTTLAHTTPRAGSERTRPVTAPERWRPSRRRTSLRLCRSPVSTGYV